MTAQLGEISSGTLRTADLIGTFAMELDWLTSRGRADRTTDESKLLAQAGEYNESEDTDESAGAELLEELTDALEAHAPPYCYFGAHEGDGACFGFWPSMDTIDELPRVDSSDEAKALGEDACFINDHGNVTVFGGDGSTIIDFV